MLIGEEVIQFMRADYMGDNRYRLSQLYRALGDGNGGQRGHESGAQCVLLNRKVQRITLPDNITQTSVNFALVSRGVDGIAHAQADVTRALRPLAPVHLTWQENTSQSYARLSWTRRSRLPFRWSDGIDIPLVEERENYLIAFWREADIDAVLQQQFASGAVPLLTMESEASEIIIEPDERETLRAMGEAIIITVRQAGTHFVSQPAYLALPEMAAISA